MRPAAAFYAFALIICSPMAWAADGDPAPQREAIAAVSQSESSDATTVAHTGAKQFRGVFGYLEFDFDSDAPGGVPGFGELSEPMKITAEARRD